MAKDAFSTLKVYLSKLAEGEHTAAEAVAAVNAWLRESGEAIKLKVEEEVEQAVAKMGFVKQVEFDKLREEFESLRNAAPDLKEGSAKKVKGLKRAVEKEATVTKKAVAKKVKVEKKIVEKKIKSAKQEVGEKAKALKKSATSKGKK